MENNLYFSLSPNCFVVKGGHMPSICDMDRGYYRYIPKDLSYILTNLRKQNLGQIKEIYSDVHESRIERWFRDLLRQGVGHFTACPRD